MMVYRRNRSTLKIILLRFCGGAVECFVCSLFSRAVMRGVLSSTYGLSLLSSNDSQLFEIEMIKRKK